MNFLNQEESNSSVESLNNPPLTNQSEDIKDHKPFSSSLLQEINQRIISNNSFTSFSIISESFQEITEKEYTIIFCRHFSLNNDKEILLGFKKRGFGVGKWDGFGGKVEDQERNEDAAKRYPF